MHISANSGKIIALTGAIASGKSLALSLFKEHGFMTVSADAIVQELYQDPKIVKQIARIAPVAESESCVEIPTLRNIITQNSQLIEHLQSIMLPRIKVRRQEIFNQSEGKSVVYEIPLLFETNQQDGFDYVISLICSEEIRRQRALRRGIKLEMFELLNSKQTTDQVRINHSDIVIDTSGSIAQIRKHIESIICL